MKSSETLSGWKYRLPVQIESDNPFKPGTLLSGSYRLVRQLSRGGMGEIFLATHERLPGQFIVKVLSPELVSKDALSRFRQEALVMARLRHPNVVQLLDFNTTFSGLPYLVMEYLPGKDLAEVLAAQPLLPAGQVFAILQQVASALYAAHRIGVVHRDLKPKNIMVIPCEGRADLIKVIDFGISKARRYSPVTGTSLIVGTPEFMSPEQAEGRDRDVGYSSDEFALAVIAYLMLTGRSPWRGTASSEILYSLANGSPLPINRRGQWPMVDLVLSRGMAKQPVERYPSTLALVRALERAMIRDGLLTKAHPQELPAYVYAEDGRETLEDGRAIPDWDGDDEGLGRQDDLDQATADEDEELQRRKQVDDGKNEVEPESFVEQSTQEQPFVTLETEDDLDSLPRSHRRSHRRRWSGVRKATALLLGIAVGFLLGLMGLSRFESRAEGAWNGIRDVAVRSAAFGVSKGHEWISRGLGRAYLSAGQKQ